MGRKCWDCDNDKCLDENAEVRVLPLGESSNLILCRACFEYEIAFRKDENKKRAKELGANLYKTPSWEDCKIYNPYQFEVRGTECDGGSEDSNGPGEY